VLLQHRLAYVSAVIVQLLLNFGFVILFQYYCIELYAIVSCKYYHHLKQNWWIKKFGSVFFKFRDFPINFSYFTIIYYSSEVGTILTFYRLDANQCNHKVFLSVAGTFCI